MQVRQGDVFVESVKKPKNLVGREFKEAPKEGGRTVLAHGEVTGHAHALPGDLAHLFVPVDERSRQEPRLRVIKSAVLFHEEHHQPETGHVIQLPAGDYEVIRQREYEPGEIRNVAD